MAALRIGLTSASSGGASTVRGDVLREQSSWKREERDQHQEYDVEHQEQPVDLLALVDDRVVVGPDDADREERDGVGDVARPDVDELAVERLHPRDGDVEDQQRRGYREHSVAECFEPACGHCSYGLVTRPGAARPRSRARLTR